MLFTVGLLASQGTFEITLLIGVLFIASVIGYALSYILGKKIREFILQSNDKYWFKKKHIEYTEHFWKKYGMKTVIIGRFVPIVRSFSPTLAGTVNMDYKKFIKYSVIGGFIWTGGVTTLGYYLGNAIPNAEKYLTPIIIIIIFVSLIPTFAEYILHKRSKQKD